MTIEVSMFGRNRTLPRVPLYALTWTIAPVFGGMTSVVLQRSTAFSDVDRCRVDILTLAPDLDPVAREKALREEGRIGDRVRLRNIWSDLRAASDRSLARMGGTVKSPVAVGDDLLAYQGGPEAQRVGDDGTVLQVDRFRPDGSLLVSDRRDTKMRGVAGGRRITLFTRRGAQLGQWTTARGFYHSWLDWVAGGRDAIVISDSSFVGGLVNDYRRDHVTLVQVLHNPHLKNPSGSVHGPLVAAKKDILTRLDSYDLVTTLTEAQREDMLRTSIAMDNLVTVPNTFAGRVEADPAPRPRRRGVMLARLARQKRVDHAVQAVARLSDQAADVTLDVYGGGPDEAKLRALVEELGVQERVRLNGHDPKAKAAFHEASFSVLSSRHEGQALVLLESMAAGCVPVAYDIKYGPASIITDGVDGFLVPAGDVEALAGAIERVATMDDEALGRMRRAAVRRSRDYLPAPVAARWGQVLAEAREGKRPVQAVRGSASLLSASATEAGIRIEAEIALPGARRPEWATVTWLGRGARAFGRVPAEFTLSQDAVHVSALLPPEALQAGGETLLDLSLDARIDGNPRRWRIAAGTAVLPVGAGGVELYATAHGNLSVKISAPPR